MKRSLRIIFGIMFIAFGLVIVFLSFGLLPQPMDWGKVLFTFLPVLLFGVGLASLGWGIISGMTWRDAFAFIIFLWR